MKKDSTYEVFLNGIKLSFRCENGCVSIYDHDNNRVGTFYRHLTEDEAHVYHNGFHSGLKRGWKEGEAAAKHKIGKILEL